nr:PREDICTED: uncharacterized protein LOC109038510 [Bemisia tabaci]XP_018909122.1 PREDICTED: uncharacterized protein LOC109038510 [Bemisia tabaci]XP_018909123.1 PREDICTED: uncharacterized protein LOC109038510 [Bemisia tabaci]
MGSADARQVSTDGIYFAVPRRILEEDDWIPPDQLDRNSPEIPDQNPELVPSIRSDDPRLMDHFGPDVDEYLLKCSLDKFENQTVATFRKDVITQLSAALKNAETCKTTGSSTDEESDTSEEEEEIRFGHKRHPIYKNVLTSQGFYKNAHRGEAAPRRSDLVKKSVLPSGEAKRSDLVAPEDGAEFEFGGKRWNSSKNPVLLSSEPPWSASLTHGDSAQKEGINLIQNEVALGTGAIESSDEESTDFSAWRESTIPTKTVITANLQDFDTKIRETAPVESLCQKRVGIDSSIQNGLGRIDLESSMSVQDLKMHDTGKTNSINVATVAELPKELNSCEISGSAETASFPETTDGEVVDQAEIKRQEGCLHMCSMDPCCESNTSESKVNHSLREKVCIDDDCATQRGTNKIHDEENALFSTKQSLFLCSMINGKSPQKSEAGSNEISVDPSKHAEDSVNFDSKHEVISHEEDGHSVAKSIKNSPGNTKFDDLGSDPSLNEELQDQIEVRVHDDEVIIAGYGDPGQETIQSSSDQSAESADAPITTQQVAFSRQTQTGVPSDLTSWESREARPELFGGFADEARRDDHPQPPAPTLPKSLPRTHVHDNFKFFRERGPKFRISDIIPECPEEEASTQGSTNAPIPKPRNIPRDVNPDVTIIVSDEDSRETVKTVVSIKPLARKRGEVPLTSGSSTSSDASSSGPSSDDAAFTISSPTSLRMPSSASTVSAFADVTSSWRSTNVPQFGRSTDEMSSPESTLLALKNMTSSLKAESEALADGTLSSITRTLPETNDITLSTSRATSIPLNSRPSSSESISACDDVTSSNLAQSTDEMSSSESTLLALKSMTSSLTSDTEAPSGRLWAQPGQSTQDMTSSMKCDREELSGGPWGSSKLAQSVQSPNEISTPLAITPTVEATARMTLCPRVTSPSSAMLAARLGPAMTSPDPVDWARFLSLDPAPPVGDASPTPDSSSLWLSCSEDERQANLLNYDLFRTDFSDADPDLNAEWPFAAAAVVAPPPPRLLSVFHSECYALHL